MNTHSIKTLSIVSFCMVILAGCVASSTPNSHISEARIYQMAMQQSNQNSLAHTREKISKPIYTQRTQNSTPDNISNREQAKLNKTFPTLPNPETLVYVYPHFGPSGTPVLGYYTKFQLYKDNHYALPGETGRNT